MKPHKPVYLVFILTVLIFVAIPSKSFAPVVKCGCYCGKVTDPPCSDEKCKQVCGWKGPSGGQSSPYIDLELERQRQLELERQRLEAERQRQQEIEDQRQREEAEARGRQADFERAKEDALRSMKGIAEGELGLKDIGDTTPGLTLKEAPSSGTTQPKKPDCEWGNMGPSVVDLRCLGLDPNKPITVDPHVVRGQQRVFPAQIDRATFENANYNEGFRALMRFDAASAGAAIEHFKQAQKERPNDPLVRNALLLAQDIFKARQQKEKDDQAQAAYLTLQSYAALMMGDSKRAKDWLAEARKLSPSDSKITFVESLSKMDLGMEGTYPQRRDAYRLVANGLVSINHQYIDAGVGMLEAAYRLQPQDEIIGLLLQKMRGYQAGPTSANTEKDR